MLDAYEFDYTFLLSSPTVKRKRGNNSKKKPKNFLDIICTFDIETSRDEETDQSFLYLWQFHFKGHGTVFGRDWESFEYLISQCDYYMPEDTTLVIYVHNLSYEFFFLRGIYRFEPDEVFATDSRKILRCDFKRRFEFRCSYFLTNMSLSVATKTYNVEHKKLDSDEYNHTLKRYPWTKLTDKELEYGANDVIGLAEVIEKILEINEDDLNTVPMTSTGFVRREVKNKTKDCRKLVQKICPNMEVYQMLVDAYRGGDTHANRYYSDTILKNVQSYDMSSSYPNSLCTCKFPMSEFKPIEPDINTIEKRIGQGMSILFEVRLTEIEPVDEFFGCPYLAFAKCRNISRDAERDNGRIIRASSLETTITDVDYAILKREYNFKCEVLKAYQSKYGMLPKSLRDTIITFYKLKTELKGVEGQEIIYAWNKAMVNSIYGMMCQRAIQENIVYHHDLDENGKMFALDESQSDEELLSKNNRRAFVAYQFGVWCTAWSRYYLHEGIHLTGDGFIYCDTDSVKYIGEVDWDELNKKLVENAKRYGAYATDRKGIVRYMGIFEHDASYDRFKTMGAKKYAFEQNGKLGVTISGVSKSKGAEELKVAGGLEAFKTGMIFKDAGGLEAVYNDFPEIQTITREGREITIMPNVCLRNSTYTLGLAEDYKKTLEFYRNCIDFSKWE